MTAAASVLLVAPDPDLPDAAEWPVAVRHRVARLWLADRIEEAPVDGAPVTVVVPTDLVPAWRGLAGWLRSIGVTATVVVGSAPVAADPGRTAPPTDTHRARTGGGRCAALFGPGSGAVRHLGLTVVGVPGAPASASGPWLVLTDEGWRTTLDRERLADPVRQLRPGQRLHALVSDVADPIGTARTARTDGADGATDATDATPSTPTIVSAWH